MDIKQSWTSCLKSHCILSWKKLIWWKNEWLVYFGVKFNFYFFLDRCTLKFLKMKCNATNKKTVVLYSRACLIRMEMYGKIVRIIQACKLSKPILHYILITDWDLCPGQPCELSRWCELARVKLSGLYCIVLPLNIAPGNVVD